MHKLKMAEARGAMFGIDGQGRIQHDWEQIVRVEH